MKFELEWLDGPGVRDNVLAATWARLNLSVGELCASEAIDLVSDSRRTGIYGSLYPLAEWLIEHWWHLLHEPSPHSPAPGGRAALPSMRRWAQRHNLLAARDGGALPDLTIARDGDDVLLKWEADPISPTPVRIRFVGQGQFRVSEAEFERSVRTFVDTVLARLEDKLHSNEQVKQTVEAWKAIHSASSAEKELCRSLAIMGVEPYNPDEANAELIETVESSIRSLPAELRADLFEDSSPQSLVSNLSWVEKGRASLRSTITDAEFPSIEAVTGQTPHETGYLVARQVRSKLLRLPSDKPLPDLSSVLEDRLGWTQGCSRVVSGKTRLDGMVGIDDASSAPLLVVAAKRNDTTERFRLARAAFFPVTRRLGTNGRLLTSSGTPLQRTTRAFAAELLVPAEALRKRISDRLSNEEVENLAGEFEVSTLVIRHQIENHDLGYMEA